MYRRLCLCGLKGERVGLHQSSTACCSVHDGISTMNSSHVVFIICHQLTHDLADTTTISELRREHVLEAECVEDLLDHEPTLYPSVEPLHRPQKAQGAHQIPEPLYPTTAQFRCTRSLDQSTTLRACLTFFTCSLPYSSSASRSTWVTQFNTNLMPTSKRVPHVMITQTPTAKTKKTSDRRDSMVLTT